MNMKIILLCFFASAVFAQKNPNYAANRTTMVHLFEWKFNDIAKECEQFLGPHGYGGVQVSPINENLILTNRPWYERYQPVSYKIITRSGNVEDFKDMVRRCNNVGVRIYVDVVFNHMSGNLNPAIGTGGTVSQPDNLQYPGVPFGPGDFHSPCGINSYNNAHEVRDCELVGLHDLDQSKEYVREQVVKFLNEIIGYGIAGMRVDAAKHMWPEDLKVIYSRLNNLNPEHGFAPNTRPYIFQEVIDLGGEAISKYEYLFAGLIEFQYGMVLGHMFRSYDDLRRLYDLERPEDWRLLRSEDALVMVDNHDNQRGHGAGGSSILTYKDPKQYKMAVAFMLAYPYGHPRIMSSFHFNDPSQGPPADKNENILSPLIKDNLCLNGWVCEHRWRQIFNMVKFRNIVGNSKIENWWAGDRNQIAFGRSNLGFVAFNASPHDLKTRIQTGLPAGRYCDVISGSLIEGKCTGQVIDVGSDGQAEFYIPAHAEDGVVAIHVEDKL